ncbi:hypothetical protein CCM_04839 [Cordyceps militaris CM01]|uniref:Uncharacterized protein n=1 Tax=Cordyceps militaris (strain CM01) TaxID=983644 RepID=G3JEX2_CORMM|nr:uncharacterized protein CCM_04839 [Cordyceps militaris CM01]EGX93465.1 hypothetical protein CCM_04839 [Cordyceps militaris CM01]
MGAVQLPPVTVWSQQTGLQADLRTSLRFCDTSPGTATISCADDIIRLRREDKLWILPATPCRMRISIQLLGRVSGQSLDMGQVARWIESCNIWERLKLRVRYCEVPGDSALSFSLQHPDVSASLSCPPTAAKRELQDLRCQVEITQTPNTRHLKKRKRANMNELRDETGHQAAEPLRTSHLNRHQSRELLTMTNYVHNRDFYNILQAAITVLVSGSARHLTDMTVRQGNTAHALARLVPAVFNVPYIKVISDRAQHMSTITGALTAMQTTVQSPALKRKLWNLADRGGIEKHLWHSIISQVNPPSLPGPKMRTIGQDEVGAVRDAGPEHGLGSNLICFGEDLLSPNFQDGIDESFEM